MVSAAAAEWHDADLLAAAAPADGSVRIEDLSERFGTLVVAGPRSRDVLAAITDADLSNAAFPWLSAREIEIGRAKALALRMTYVGELGWELHAPGEHLPAIYEAASARRGAGSRRRHLRELTACGWTSATGVGRRSWRAAIRRSKQDSTASSISTSRISSDASALLAERRRGAARRLVPLVLAEPGDADAPACASCCRIGTASAW